LSSEKPKTLPPSVAWTLKSGAGLPNAKAAWPVIGNASIKLQAPQANAPDKRSDIMVCLVA
jgi:hypothetical protein